MKLLINATIRGAEITLNPGDTFETENINLANALLESGVATKVEEVPEVVPSVENTKDEKVSEETPKEVSVEGVTEVTEEVQEEQPKKGRK